MLQLDEDLKHQALTWRFERIGWAGMLLVAALALTGLLGGGPLSSGEAGKADSKLFIEFERFLRYASDNKLKITLRSSNERGELTLNSDFLEGYEIESIQPEPDTTELRPGRGVFVFKTKASHEPLQIIFRMRPAKIGPLKAVAQFEDTTVHFLQFIYP